MHRADQSRMGIDLLACRLRGEIRGLSRSLRGFQKGHRVPDEHFGAAESFVRRAGREDVTLQADKIHEGLRKTFGFKRKDLTYTVEEGSASLRTPDFEVAISVGQDPAEASGYVLATEVGMIRRPAVLSEPPFAALFSPYCDTIVIELPQPLDLAAKIDQIEDSPALAPHLEYPPDCSWLTLRLPEPGLRVDVTARRLSFALTGRRDLAALVRSTQAALGSFDASGLFLAPPAAPG